MLVPLLTGCAQDRLLHVVGPYPESPSIERCLLYWTSNFATNATNHYYVGATKPSGGFVDAFVYWKEERTILEYAELDPEAPPGTEIEAFHHLLKLDRDTVDTPEDRAGSTYLETHRTWLDWMDGYLSRGREYLINPEESRRLSPKESISHDN